MPPKWWHHNHFTNSCMYGIAPSRVVGHIFLHINNSLAMPNFINLWSGPSFSISGTRMNMSLTPYGLFAQSSTGIGNHPKEQMQFFQQLAMPFFANIHGNGIYN